jgi:hypothetical protein
LTPNRIVAAFFGTGLVIGTSAENTLALEDAQAIVMNAAPDTKNLLRITKKRERKDGDASLPAHKKLLFSPDPTVATRDFLRHMCITAEGSLHLEVDKPDKKLKVVEGKIATNSEWITERAKQREGKEEKEEKKEEKKITTVANRRKFWAEKIEELLPLVDWAVHHGEPVDEHQKQELVDLKLKTYTLINQTRSAITGYLPQFLQSLTYPMIKEEVKKIRDKIEGYLVAFTGKRLILLETKEMNAIAKAKAKEAKVQQITDEKKAKKDAKTKDKEEKIQAMVNAKKTKTKEKEARKQAKLLLELGHAKTAVCSSCEGQPLVWQGCDYCGLWFCDICWGLESENDSSCIYCQLARA